MRLNRRQFFQTATGALAFASIPAVLTNAGIAKEKPIKVANILDKTGILNIYSLKQIQAAAMAVDEINAKGGLLGRPVELLFYDSQSDGQYNSKYVTEALVKDKVHVVHAGITSSSREVMRPIVSRFKGLLFYNSLYEGGVCDKRHVSTGMVPAQQLEPLINHVIKKLGHKRCYILAADYNYGHITSKWMKKFVRESGGEDLAVEFFPLDVNNFQPAISRIQKAKPDVVLSALVGGAHIAFYRQFQSTIGKDISLASSTYGVGLEHTQLSAEEGNGIIIASSYVDDLETPEAKAFVKRFQNYTGDMSYVGEYGEYGERGINLWAESVIQAKSPDPEASIEALSRGRISVQGAGGKYTVDGKTNHTTMDIHIVSGINNRFKVIESFKQRPPRDTQLVCDLHANPNDNTQYEPEV
tara:strand:+ start:22687 stop:23925 length:1239 start_codon:yes stop_codon:yes gene_type:complete